MKNAIIYLTHHTTEHDNIQLTSLTDIWNCKNCENDLYVVMDITNAAQNTNRQFHIKNLSSNKLASPKLIELTETKVTEYLSQLNYVIEYYETTRNPLFYGNCMLMIMYVWLNLLKDINYDYIWVIEHDVYFKGNWSHLFDFFSDKTEDFIPAQINSYSTEFWHAHQYNFKENIPIEKFLISFNPIMRLSKLAMNTLDASYRNGSSGFYEIFPATLFNHINNLTLKDMCEFGFADRERFTYIKNHSLDKKLINKENFLYHPIKDVSSLTTRNNKDIRTAIVCMAANENLYIRDFVKWHLIIGFTKIFIVDNSPINSESMDFILTDYITSGRVQIIKLRKTKLTNPPLMQMIVYTELYEIFHNEFDWMFFIDVDEFVSMKNTTNIGEFLSNERFENAEQIRFNWMCYGDNGKLYYDNLPVWKRFPNPMKDITKHDWAGAYPVNSSLKTAVNCKSKFADFITRKTPHAPITESLLNAVIISPSGRPIKWTRTVGDIDFKEAWLAHYRSLTITEFLNRRLSNQTLEQANGNVYTKDALLALFCVENEMTPEKQKIWDDYMKKVETEHPDIFSSKKKEEIERKLSSEEIQELRNAIRNVIIRKAEWTY